MNPLQIRTAEEQDAENINTVLAAAFEAFRHQYTEAAFVATVIDPAEVRRRMGEGPVWVATHDGKVVGTVSLLLRNEGAYVRGMAVLPDLQGLKIGLTLLQATEEFAVAAGCLRLFLRTTPYLDKAIRLYERFGFVAIGTEQEDFFGTPSFLMEKNLRHSRET